MHNGDRPRIGDFHDRVAAAVPCVPDDDETRAALRGRRLADVLGVFLNHHGRFVPARPRNVDYAADFWTSQAVRVEADIAALEGRIKRGEDLGPYMSPNIGRNGFVASNGRQRWEPARDLALNAFGVHHLHLTPGKGSDALAFIAFSRIAAVFVMLGPHKSFDDGSLADAVARYQAQTGREIKSAWPSGTTPSPRDQMKLARHCVSSFGNADGKLTMGASVMSNGDGLRMRRYADFIARQVAAIDPMLDDPVQVDALMPAARGTWGPEVDFEWHMQDTDLVLYERNSRTLCPVLNGFC